IEMYLYFTIRGLLQGYQEPNEAIEESRKWIEILQRLQVTVRVDTYRAMSHLILLFAQRKRGDEKLDWSLFDQLLRRLITEPYISTREYEYLMIMGPALKSM